MRFAASASARSARTHATPAGSDGGSCLVTPATFQPASRNAATTPPPAPPLAPVIRTRPGSAMRLPSPAGLGRPRLRAIRGGQRLAEDPDSGVDRGGIDDQRRAEAERRLAALQGQQAAVEGGLL